MKKGRIVLNIALIVASGLASFFRLDGATPPPGFLRKIAERETASEQARSEYTYRQTVIVQEFNDRGAVTGEYHESRDITFSPTRVRYEKVSEPAFNTLSRIKLTPVDFQDIRDIEPFLLTVDRVSLYEGEYKGEEAVEGTPCFIEHVRPKQILSGQRFFEGLLWVRESDFSVMKSEGQSVPQIETLKEQNLTPHFTTIRRLIDSKWFFPTETYADDTLYFRDWPQRIRIEVRYLNYRRFGAESTVIFGVPEQTQPPPAQGGTAPPASQPPPPPPHR